jgi:hypothetical protein
MARHRVYDAARAAKHLGITLVLANTTEKVLNNPVFKYLINTSWRC